MSVLPTNHPELEGKCIQNFSLSDSSCSRQLRSGTGPIMPESRCFQDAASERTKFKQIGAMLVKVIDEHDVAVYIALL
jgi:hypothetical protein